jgi:3-deoxy-manno-octulosonate cytidylyltransferase (CMP-KDO synthetase)
MINGKPMIQHVYKKAVSCRLVSDVLVATDDDRIRQVVEQFGGRVVMVAGDYRSGTDRVAAVARMVPGEFFVDLQGDEIPVNPELLSDLIEPFIQSGTEMGTLKRAMGSPEDLHNPSVVKVVTDVRGYALYFSRAPIPLVRDDPDRGAVGGLHYIHLGLYMYTKDTLLRFAALPTSPLEEAEKLEQLRALENGIRIRVWPTEHVSLRVDRREDIPGVAEKMQQYEMIKRDLEIKGAALGR